MSNQSLSKNRIYRAAWVLPIDGEPIRDGVVTVSQTHIVSVGPYHARQHAANMLDLGPVAIIPGMVNSHTHLEFSDLKRPLGVPGIEFTDWIREIVRNRREKMLESTEKRRAIRTGLNESFAGGVWCLGDIATTPISWNDYCDSSMKEQIELQQPFVV